MFMIFWCILIVYYAVDYLITCFGKAILIHKRGENDAVILFYLIYKYALKLFYWSKNLHHIKIFILSYILATSIIQAKEKKHGCL